MTLLRNIGSGIADMFIDLWDDDLLGKFMAILLAACVLLVCALPFILYADNKDLAEWKRWCATQDDTHVETSTETGVMPAGKTVVVTSDTSYYCLTSDGRILDIRD